MRVLLSFFILLSVKIASHLFYRTKVSWLQTPSAKPFSRIKVLAYLNHTSLYEPLFVSVMPISFLWQFAQRMSAPGASKTLERPIVGLFWKILAPNMTSISRKRDDTWEEFLKTINDSSIITITPEGRMKRPNGLDLNGNPMTIKSGIADILEGIDHGNMLIAYSGGLHHVQAPGEKWPRIFKTITMNLELLPINDYKKMIQSKYPDLKNGIVADLQQRLENNCPKEIKS